MYVCLEHLWQVLSVPGTLPDFICCITCVTSCSVGTPVAISRLSFGVCVWGGGLVLAVMVANSLFRTSEKSLTHLLAWESSVELYCS